MPMPSGPSLSLHPRAAGLFLALMPQVGASYTVSHIMGCSGVPISRCPPPRMNTGSRLMLVEDSSGMRSAIQRYLMEHGFHCDTFESAGEALRAMMRDPPDLVVTDVMMQDMDGHQLLQRIRSDPHICAVPVVLLTARGLSADRISGYKAGASAYVSKPFDPEELLAVINSMLLNSNLARAALFQSELQAAAPPPAFVDCLPALLAPQLARTGLKDDVAVVKRLLLLLLQAQTKGVPAEVAEAAARDAPKLLTQLQQADLSSSAALVALGVPKPSLPKLTMRERTVLELVGEGMLNKEIAGRLGVSKSHIEKYVRRLLTKTGTTNRTELVRRALQLGLLVDGAGGVVSPTSATQASPFVMRGSPSLTPVEAVTSAEKDNRTQATKR